EPSVNNKMFGNITLDTDWHTIYRMRGNGQKIPQNSLVVDSVAVNVGKAVVYARAAKDSNFTNISVFNTAAGFLADEGGTSYTSSLPLSIYVKNTVINGSKSDAFRFVGQDS